MGKIIRKEWFRGDKNLTSLYIPDTYTIIEERAFEGCINLEEVHLNESIIDIQDFAFKDTGLKDIHIPDSVKAIGIGVFKGCRNLESIRMPKEVICLSKHALLGCSNLKRLILPQNLMEVEELIGHIGQLNALDIYAKKDSLTHESLIKAEIKCIFY